MAPKTGKKGLGKSIKSKKQKGNVKKAKNVKKNTIKEKDKEIKEINVNENDNNLKDRKEKDIKERDLKESEIKDVDKKTRDSYYRKDKYKNGKEKKHLEYGKFLMRKGDKYTGYYWRNIYGDVFRHGRGVYETYDGQIYEGLWYMDHLVNNDMVKIIYEDGCMYEGTIQNYQYDGHGVYTFTNGAKLQCNFRKNKPISKIELIDPNGLVWIGQIENDRSCILQLRNIFYRNIPVQLGLPIYEHQFDEEYNNEDINNFDQILYLSNGNGTN